jgi:class 3 adenylate cyclase
MLVPGSEMTPDAKAPAPLERKSVTVVFADLVNSTDLVIRLGPERAYELFRRVLDALAGAARRYGGRVEKSAGDELMAVFGAPRAEEDHALAGCCAALAMQDALAAEMPGGSLRVGVHSGEVVVNPNESPYSIMVAGDVVHLAKRVQTTASPGAIWISAATHAFAAGRIAVRPVGHHVVAGFADPVEMFRLEAADPSVTRLEVPLERPLSPFIGRAFELAALATAAGRAMATEGQAIALVGEAGAGKSRLIREALARLPSDVAVFEARCTRWREDAPFHPLRPLLRRVLGLGEAGEAAVLPARPGQDGDALAALLDLPGRSREWASLAPARRGRRMIAAAADTLLAAAENGPAVIVLDDLHWTDPETEQVVAALLPRLARARLLLVLGWRPDRPPAFAVEARLTTLAIRPLAPAEAAQLAAELLGGDDAEEAARIAERCGGNPLFIEAEVAALHDAPAGGAGPRVSPTVRGLIASRIDRLGAPERTVMEALAVLGEASPERVVAETIGFDAQEVGESLARLAPSGLARAEASGAERLWSCCHALYQDVAYIGMSLARRRVLHGRVAASLAATPGAEPSAVARHARLGEDWRRMLDFAREAGRRAAARNANRAAVEHFSEAIAALDRLPESAETLALAVDLRFDLRNQLFRLGRIAELRARLEEAGPPAERLADPARLGQLQVHMSHHAWLAGDYPAALAAAARAEALAAETGDAALALRAVFQRGLAHVGLCEMDRAAAEMAEVAARAEDPALGGRYGLDTALAATALAYRVRALADAGRFAEAEQSLAEAEEKVACVGREIQFYTIFVRIAGGYMLLRRGEADAARGPLREAARLCDETEADLMRPVALSFLGAAEAACGAREEGIAMLERAVTLAAEMGFLFQQDVRLRLLAACRSTTEGATRA